MTDFIQPISTSKVNPAEVLSNPCSTNVTLIEVALGYGQEREPLHSISVPGNGKAEECETDYFEVYLAFDVSL
jgi:hypothetical protein